MIYFHIPGIIRLILWPFPLQMFDACLAPDTAGDGSGCDNMTCIIVLFNDTLVDSGLSSRKRTDKQANDEQPPKKQRLEL